MLTIRKTSDLLVAHRERYYWITRILARWCIDIPELEFKTTAARLLYDCAAAEAACAQRLEELSFDGEYKASDVSLMSNFSDCLDLKTTREKMMWLVHSWFPRQLRELESHLVESDPLLDEPTSRLVRLLFSESDQRISEVKARIEEYGCILEDERPSSLGKGISLTAPQAPSRDRRFRLEGEVFDPSGAADEKQKVIHLLHLNLTDLEIATIEACARLVLDFSNLGRDFVLDMGRQIWDEARHAECFHQALLKLGGRLGEFSISHILWEMATGQPLEVRLDLHQRIGEWTGVDGALYYARKLNVPEFAGLSESFDFIARDEINHVAFGNKWIGRIIGDGSIEEVDALAANRRREFGKSSDGALTFPFNRWACERCGFSENQVDRLEYRYRKYGSRFS